MNSYVEVVVLVEGRTEKIFIEELLAPYLTEKGVFLTPIIISKSGQKGGDIKFSRVKNDIEQHLKQRHSTYLTMLIDFYGIRNDWPGLAEARKHTEPCGKAATLNSATRQRVIELFEGNDAERRFIPYISMHEFEALLFSEPEKIAEALHVPHSDVSKIITECGEPENINDAPETAPSKRLEKFSSGFRKTSTGIAIAREIGIPKMRAACPLFNSWLEKLESLAGGANE